MQGMWAFLKIVARNLFVCYINAKIVVLKVWCSAVTTEAIGLQIEKDSHCPPKYRVIGPLSNLPEFSTEFNCPKGSKMNPIHKCEVW